MTTRRTFVAGLGAAAGSSVIWPLAARAQRPTLPIIGLLSSGVTVRPPFTPGFIRGALREGDPIHTQPGRHLLPYGHSVVLEGWAVT